MRSRPGLPPPPPALRSLRTRAGPPVRHLFGLLATSARRARGRRARPARPRPPRPRVTAPALRRDGGVTKRQRLRPILSFTGPAAAAAAAAPAVWEIVVREGGGSGRARRGWERNLASPFLSHSQRGPRTRLAAAPSCLLFSLPPWSGEAVLPIPRCGRRIPARALQLGCKEILRA